MGIFRKRERVDVNDAPEEELQAETPESTSKGSFIDSFSDSAERVASIKGIPVEQELDEREEENEKIASGKLETFVKFLNAQLPQSDILDVYDRPHDSVFEPIYPNYERSHSILRGRYGRDGMATLDTYSLPFFDERRIVMDHGVSVQRERAQGRFDAIAPGRFVDTVTDEELGESKVFIAACGRITIASPEDVGELMLRPSPSIGAQIALQMTDHRGAQKSPEYQDTPSEPQYDVTREHPGPVKKRTSGLRIFRIIESEEQKNNEGNPKRRIEELGMIVGFGIKGDMQIETPEYTHARIRQAHGEEVELPEKSYYSGSDPEYKEIEDYINTLVALEDIRERESKG